MESMSPDMSPQPGNVEAKKPIDMKAFRAEIAALIAERKNILREIEMDLNDLNEKDAKMWYRIKNYTKGSITREDLEKYRKDTTESENSTRISFMGGIIVNTLTGIWGKEDLERLGIKI